MGHVQKRPQEADRLWGDGFSPKERVDQAQTLSLNPGLGLRTEPGLEAECGSKQDNWAETKVGGIGPAPVSCCQFRGDGGAAAVKLHPEPVPGSVMTGSEMKQMEVMETPS